MASIIGSGPQMKAVSTEADVDPVLEQRLALGRVDAAGEEADLLRLAFQHVQQGEPAEVAVLGVFELLAEHDRGDLPVGVDQGEARPRFAGEQGLEDREHRSDAAAAGEAEVVAGASGSTGVWKLPMGGIASSSAPGASASFAQVEKAPPSTRLMPTFSTPSSLPAQIE